MTIEEEYHSLGKWGNLQSGEDHWSLYRKEKEGKKKKERETRKLKRPMMTHYSQARIILITVTKQRRFQLRTSN